MQSDVSTSVKRTSNFIADAVSLIIETGRQAVSRSGLFRLGLAGGNTPRAVYAALAQQAAALPWDRVQVTFGDERCVPPDHADSNYRMAAESLLSHVPIPEGNIFRIKGEIPHEQAALECESRLAAVAARFGEERYEHDLLLLGLGEDGHTASLFPGSPALEESVRNVIPATGPKPPPQRITFTFPLINASKLIVFLLNDPKKEALLQGALRGEYPSGKVAPSQGRVVWLAGE